MRPGGSNPKGSAFERKTGGLLSAWLTKGERRDLFSRNVLSGGQFTASLGERGSPGDLMAAHPRAFRFLSAFVVECKHRRNLELAQFLLDTGGKSFLSRTVRKADAEGRQAGRHFLVVAAQNYITPVVLTSTAVGGILVPYMRTHTLHSHTVVMAHLSGLLALDPDEFLDWVEALPPPRPRPKVRKFT